MKVAVSKFDILKQPLLLTLSRRGFGILQTGNEGVMAEKKITKVELIDAICQKTGMNRKDIKKIFELLIDEIKNALIDYQIIELRGFGTFEIKIRKGRKKARNPRTGEIVSVNSHGVVNFRAGRELKQEVWKLKMDNAVFIEKNGSKKLNKMDFLPEDRQDGGDINPDADPCNPGGGK
jgi:integration host factor subunit beta